MNIKAGTCNRETKRDKAISSSTVLVMKKTTADMLVTAPGMVFNVIIIDLSHCRYLECGG